MYFEPPVCLGGGLRGEIRQFLCQTPEWNCMTSQKTITFRSQITGTLSDLIRDEGVVCQHSVDFLSALAGGILRYRDEGVELSPTIIYSTDIDKVLVSFPGTVKYAIGEVDANPNSVKKILKDCAPLAMGSWCIFIERTGQMRLKYGVFYYNTLPTTLPISDAISICSNVFCVLVTKTSPSTVEICGSKGNELSMVFSTTREESVAPDNSINDFAMDCCSGITESADREDFKKYFTHLLNKVLTESHGTILICCSSAKLQTISELQDRIPLNPKLDFFSTFAIYKNSNSAESLMKLQSCEKLLSGILMCDGTVVFDAFGSVTDYRIFYRSNTPNEIPQVADGGARRRAFEGIKGLLGGEFNSTLFRSQDGLTMCARKEVNE